MHRNKDVYSPSTEYSDSDSDTDSDTSEAGGIESVSGWAVIGTSRLGIGTQRAIRGNKNWRESLLASGRGRGSTTTPTTTSTSMTPTPSRCLPVPPSPANIRAALASTAIPRPTPLAPVHRRLPRARVSTATSPAVPTPSSPNHGTAPSPQAPPQAPANPSAPRPTRLTTSGHILFAPIPDTCRAEAADYVPHRRLWAQREIPLLSEAGKAEGLKVGTVSFSDKGMSIAWTSRRAVRASDLYARIAEARARVGENAASPDNIQIRGPPKKRRRIAERETKAEREALDGGGMQVELRVDEDIEEKKVRVVKMEDTLPTLTEQSRMELASVKSEAEDSEMELPGWDAGEAMALEVGKGTKTNRVRDEREAAAPGKQVANHFASVQPMEAWAKVIAEDVPRRERTQDSAAECAVYVDATKEPGLPRVMGLKGRYMLRVSESELDSAGNDGLRRIMEVGVQVGTQAAGRGGESVVGKRANGRQVSSDVRVNATGGPSTRKETEDPISGHYEAVPANVKKAHTRVASKGITPRHALVVDIMAVGQGKVHKGSQPTTLTSGTVDSIPSADTITITSRDTKSSSRSNSSTISEPPSLLSLVSGDIADRWRHMDNSTSPESAPAPTIKLETNKTQHPETSPQLAQPIVVIYPTAAGPALGVHSADRGTFQSPSTSSAKFPPHAPTLRGTSGRHQPTDAGAEAHPILVSPVGTQAVLLDTAAAGGSIADGDPLQDSGSDVVVFVAPQEEANAGMRSQESSRDVPAAQVTAVPQIPDPFSAKSGGMELPVGIQTANGDPYDGPGTDPLMNASAPSLILDDPLDQTRDGTTKLTPLEFTCPELDWPTLTGTDGGVDRSIEAGYDIMSDGNGEAEGGDGITQAALEFLVRYIEIFDGDRSLLGHAYVTNALFSTRVVHAGREGVLQGKDFAGPPSLFQGRSRILESLLSLGPYQFCPPGGGDAEVEYDVLPLLDVEDQVLLIMHGTVTFNMPCEDKSGVSQNTMKAKGRRVFVDQSFILRWSENGEGGDWPLMVVCHQMVLRDVMV